MFKRLTFSLGGAAFAALILGSLALARTGTGAGTLSSADRSFLRDNAQGSVYDLSLAELGMQRATTGPLYTYARRVVSDHDRLNLEALDLGRTVRVDLPLTLSSEDKGRLTRMTTLRGKAFDRAFLQEEVRINAEDVSKAGQTLRTTANAGVRRFGADFRATENRHLQGARALLRQAGTR